jgi:hypothetical protein
MSNQLSFFYHQVSHDFQDDLRSFCFNGQKTIVEYIDNIPYFINEFWTSKQRKANNIHEVSYRACFKPQLPAFFIERLSKPNDIIYDPFMGRGTTAIESALQNRIPYGNDINPVSIALAEPRVNAPSYNDIIKRLQQIPWQQFEEINNSELLVFYHHKTLAQIEGLKNWLITRSKNEELDFIDKWIRMVAINRLTGHSSGFFSVYTLPPNQAVSVERQQKINEKYTQTPPYRDVMSIIAKKSKQLLSNDAPKINEYRFFNNAAHQTNEIEDNCVTLTITSPPFLDIVNYEADNWLRCWFLGIDSKLIKISSHRNIEDWCDFIKNTLQELSRITKIGGHIAFEVGEVRGGTIRLEETVIKAGSGLNLEVIGVMINQQNFTKTSNCWGINNNKAGTNSNRIVIFRKTS